MSAPTYNRTIYTRPADQVPGDYVGHDNSFNFSCTCDFDQISASGILRPNREPGIQLTNHSIAVHDGLIVCDISAQMVGIRTVPDPMSTYVLTVSGNIRVQGDMRIEGSVQQVDISEFTSESLTINNDGTGPALSVNQSGSQDIAQFAQNGRTVIAVKDGGNVGIGRPSPAFSHDVSGVGNADAVYQEGFLLVPTGTVVSYIAASAPNGWLLCNGAAVSRNTYARLYAIIGTTYGIGDGINTFNLPDLQGRAVIGAGTGAGLTARSLGQSGGEETHTLTISEMPAHSHTSNASGGSIGLITSTGSNTASAGLDSSANEPDLYASLPALVINSTGGGTAHNNMQPFVVLNYIIKY